MVDNDRFIQALRESPPPDVTIPPDAVERITRGVRRSRRRRVAGATAVIVMAAIPVSYGGSRALDSGSSAPGIAPSTAGKPSTGDRQSPDSQNVAADVPDRVKNQLENQGYLLEPSSVRTSVTADEAVAAARPEYAPADAPVVAASLYSVTTPDLGTLEDPGNPDSAVIPKFDHQPLWVLTFDVMVPEFGVAHPPGFDQEETFVPGTLVVFVDAGTGQPQRSISW
jgi:hypothetical protein